MAIYKSEKRTQEYLKKLGYFFMRAGRSFGLWDFVAMNHKEILLIQTKLGQGPRSTEMARLKAFNLYPKIRCIKKQIWLWRPRKHGPIIKEVG